MRHGVREARRKASVQGLSTGPCNDICSCGHGLGGYERGRLQQGIAGYSREVIVDCVKIELAVVRFTCLGAGQAGMGRVTRNSMAARATRCRGSR